MTKAWMRCSVALVAFTASVAWAQAPAPAQKKGDPKVAECRQHNGQEHKAVMDMHSKARAEKKIDAREEKNFQAMEKRLHTHQQMLAKDGLTLQECERIGKEIAHEKAAVARMAATGPSLADKKGKPDPKVAECQKGNAQAHSEAMKMFADARKSGKIDKKEAQELSAREKRLSQHRSAMSRDGLTLAECQQLGKEIAAEKAAVARMAK